MKVEAIHLPANGVPRSCRPLWVGDRAERVGLPRTFHLLTSLVLPILPQATGTP